DREEHLKRWRGIAEHVFWRTDFQGFWPPEMGFSMELIPLLKRMGYEYVLVDSEHVEAITPMSWPALRYRPHVAKYGDDEIIVIVRDRELSDAQESGMDYAWFGNEVNARTQWCDFPALVTTCTDGDNGGWFRNTTAGSNFWSSFYTELMDAARVSEEAVRPCFIHDYISRHGVSGEVRVKTGAWNTGWHDGKNFTQWTGSQVQKDALRRVNDASKAIHDAQREAEGQSFGAERNNKLEQAMWHLLRAETSCHFYWGEAWADRCHQDLDEALQSLRESQAIQ
ncbi:MAG: glycoside hydrolase family 57, partial [Pseudomonadota bacterium]